MLPAKPKLRKVLRRDGQEVIMGEIRVGNSLNYPSKTGMRFAKKPNIVIRDDTVSKSKLKKLSRKLSDDRVIEPVGSMDEEGDKE